MHDKPENILPTLATICGVIAVIILAYGWFHTSSHDGVVAGFKWRNVIEIQRYAQVRDGSWKSSVPDDAYNWNCYDKQDGETCIDVGNNMSACSPDYRKWCDYTVDRWIKAREIVTKNDYRDNPAPYWGEVILQEGSPYGAERESKRNELRWLQIRTDKSLVVCRVKETDWTGADLNQQVAIAKRALFGYNCDTLKFTGE